MEIARLAETPLHNPSHLSGLRQGTLLTLALGLSYIIYYPLTRDNYFFSDDFVWLDFAARAKSLGQVLAINPGHLYDPLLNLYFFITYQLFGLSPLPYYLVGLSLHGLNAYLVLLLCQKLRLGPLPSAIAAALFLTQVQGAEAVLWIAAIGHIWATFFMLLSLIWLITWLEKNKILYLNLSFLSAACALLIKETAYALPLLLTTCAALVLWQNHIQYKLRKFLQLMLPITSLWLTYGIIQLNIQGKNLAELLPRATTTTFGLGLALIATLALFIAYLPTAQRRLCISLAGIAWVACFVLFIHGFGLGELANRYIYVLSIGAILALAPLVPYNLHRSKPAYLVVPGLFALVSLNITQVIKLDQKIYNPISQHSNAVMTTFPAQALTASTVYVVNGFPYDNVPYLTPALRLYYGADQQQIQLIYTDCPSELEALHSNQVVRYNYAKLTWEFALNGSRLARAATCQS